MCWLLQQKRIAWSIGALLLYALLVLVLQWLPHYDLIATLLLVYVVLRSISPLNGSAQRLALIGFFLAIAAITLVHQWDVGVGGRHALLGGILPWSDAVDFLSDALRRIYGLPYTLHSTKRPIYPLVLSLLLRVTAGDLRLTLLIFAAGAAILAGLATYVVLRDYGYRAATVLALLLILYLRRYLFVVGTETGGFLCGTAAFWFFWSTIRKSAAPLDATAIPGFIAGTFLLTIGLLTRAGPMFVLPALFVFAYREFIPGTRGRLIGLMAVVVLLAGAGNMLLVKTTGPGTAFSDYPAIFYGLLHSKDFTYIFDAHPEIATVAPLDRASFIFAIVANELAQRPWQLPLGMLRSVASFAAGPHGLFSLIFYTTDDHYLDDPRPLFNAIVTLVRTAGPYRAFNLLAFGATSTLFALATLTAFAWIGRRHASLPIERFLALVTAAVILSAAFTPPWITEGGQLQAATVCFITSFAAVIFLGKEYNLSQSPATYVPSPPSPALSWSASMAVLLILLVAWLEPRIAPAFPPPDACANAVSPARLYLPSTRVDVTRESRHGFTLARFKENLFFLTRHNPAIATPLATQVTEGTSVELTYDPCNGHVDAIVAPRETFEAIGGGWSSQAVVPLGEPDHSTSSNAGVLGLK